MNFDFVILTTFWGLSITIKHLIGCAALLVIIIPIAYIVGVIATDGLEESNIKTFFTGIAVIILCSIFVLALAGLMWLIWWAFS